MPTETTSTAKSIWCSHCGKRFTRKEHLERHIPTHTNVKPYTDLLQRHIGTYHQEKVPGDLSAAGPLAVSGRTPIACGNCASAKTGCDKRVPCQRCREKNLECTPRFARRSSKVAARTSQAMGDYHDQSTQGTQLTAQQASQQQQMQTAPNSVVFGLDHPLAQSPGPLSSPVMFNGLVQTLDPRLQNPTVGYRSSPSHTQLSPVATSFQLATPDNANYLQGLEHMAPSFPDFSQSYSGIFPPWGHGEGGFGYTELNDQSDMLLTNYPDLGESSPSTAPLSTPSLGTAHTRGTSIISGDIDLQQMHKPLELRFDAVASRSVILEFEDVVKAEASWPLARCNTPLYSGKCPRTALTHLTFFERSSKGHDTWTPLENYVRNHVNWEDEDLTAVVPLQSHTRDSMLAITQKFLHKALEIHGSSGGRDGYSGFVVLPPSDIIQYFLRSYVRSLSVYYPLVISNCVNPNDMLADCRPSTLLLLLMIAQGAAAMPVAEARYLSTGLTETCRISLFDIIEKNVELSADPVALRCALLFTLLGSWSGDKWLMDIAMGQRGMYMSMLKHAGMLEPQPLPILDLGGDNIKAQQEAWISKESRNRLVYNWVMLDHELSLFHDSVPLLAITELQCPLPAPEALWTALDATNWAAVMQTMYGLQPHMNPQMLSCRSQTSSLCELFQLFLQNNLSGRHTSLTPQQLRLLLHPIQGMLCHVRQLHSCLPETLTNRQTGVPSVNKDSTQQRIREIQTVLQQWYSLTINHCAKDAHCALSRCNLVLYHLMYLNTVTNFPEIERLARREGFDDNNSYHNLELSLRHKRCVFEREQAVLHCGQVLRLLRQMPRNRRPSWWTAAMYRAILILWADSISHMDGDFKSDEFGDMSNGGQSRGSTQWKPKLQMVPIDQVGQDDPVLAACLWKRKGIPVLSRLDGSAIALDNPAEVLDYGINTVDEADSSRIGDGIRRKLLGLLNNWRDIDSSVGAAI
ncbi:hypothetical protein CONLIGDRAFT_686569 [Coniochaeta ligniaria NRRL 30616]|uniref:Transcription factor Cmr1 n=1 Tax=Coniochaeta ligniaria NRRL 30616 TaxID=1408157 RepID=A0A1J7J1B4_9PEZI|nr:hypothetical protein CONLIGDRAFT_686569 [Coniochaeta ligniaria NRRL 30616]